MSWSVSASGSPAEVRGQLSEQFKYPLAEKPYGIDHDGERDTVQHVSDLLEQITTTFDPEKKLTIAASGHISFSDYETKTGAVQTVSITVTPLA